MTALTIVAGVVIVAFFAAAFFLVGAPMAFDHFIFNREDNVEHQEQEDTQPQLRAQTAQAMRDTGTLPAQLAAMLGALVSQSAVKVGLLNEVTLHRLIVEGATNDPAGSQASILAFCESVAQAIEANEAPATEAEGIAAAMRGVADLAVVLGRVSATNNSSARKVTQRAVDAGLLDEYVVPLLGEQLWPLEKKYDAEAFKAFQYALADIVEGKVEAPADPDADATGCNCEHEEATPERRVAVAARLREIAVAMQPLSEGEQTREKVDAGLPFVTEACMLEYEAYDADWISREEADAIMDEDQSNAGFVAALPRLADCIEHGALVAV